MKESEKDVVISITAGTIVKGILIFLCAWALWILRDLLLVIVTAVILASSIEPGIKFLGRFGVNRILAVLMMYVGIAAVFFGIIYAFVPPIVDEASDITQRIPNMIHSIDQSIFGGKGILPATFGWKDIAGGTATSPALGEFLSDISGVSSASRGVIGTASAVFGGVFSFILIVILSFYFAMQERGIENFLKIVIPFGKETYAIDLWERSKHKIGKWMQGQMLLGVLIFVLVYLGLTIFSVPYAMSLALLAGALEIIPVFGPIISAIPGVILAFTVGGPTLSLIIAGFYLLVQQFESHLIYPLVVRKVVGVPPILVILALIIGAELGGLLGILISVPVAAVIMEVVEDIERKKGMLV